MFVPRLRCLRRFRRDEQGAVLVYVSLMLPVLVGFGVLAVDAARLSNLATSLQKGADALALAGAAELDRKLDAIMRANAAISNMVDNEHKFGAASPGGVVPTSIRYLSDLPGMDSEPVDAYVTEDPTSAYFVEVTVAPQTLNTILPASFFGGSNTATATARAVAGFEAAVCQFTPMFMCNPFEGTGTTIFEAIKDPAIRRRQIKLRMKAGGTSQYAPGNYGFLQPPGGERGADEIRKMLALVHPPACFRQNGVELRPGFIGSAQQGLNVRFDIYDGAMSGKKSDPDFRPALNVRKGYKNCKSKRPEEDLTQYRGLPDDTCFGTGGSCVGERFGDGVWDIDGYKMANNLGDIPYSSANPASRYEVYRYELEHGLVNRESVGGETGQPQCYGDPSTLSDEPDRRLLYIAAINCLEHNVSEENTGNSGPPVPVAAFVKLFLTKPVTTPEQEISGEIVELIEPGTASNKVVRDMVQLYR